MRTGGWSAMPSESAIITRSTATGMIFGIPADIGKLSPTYQGKLAALPSSEILNIPKLPAEVYTLYFGTDTDMNGRLDTDSLVFSQVRITKRDEFVSATSFGNIGVGNKIQGYALTSVNPNFSDSTRAAEETNIIKVDVKGWK